MIGAGTYAQAAHTITMGHVVLLGDSVFDNAAYVSGGPDVVTQLRERLPQGWRASLNAVDGSVVASLPQQLARMPADATHLVISAGGNDALGYSSILSAASRSMAESIGKLADIHDEFQERYRASITTVLNRGLPTALCSIYDPRYTDPLQRRLATTALAIINDVILREAARLGLPLLDLRAICSDDADFANPIEPSSQGGWKIAGVIASVLAQHDFPRGRSAIFIR
jgi:lysophospholipase L1-like esterase